MSQNQRDLLWGIWYVQSALGTFTYLFHTHTFANKVDAAMLCGFGAIFWPAYWSYQGWRWFLGL